MIHYSVIAIYVKLLSNTYNLKVINKKNSNIEWNTLWSYLLGKRV